MTAEEHGENGRRGRFAAFLVLAMLFAATVGALPPAEAQASGGPYELNIEVDYFEGLLWPEVIEAFDFLVTYFEDRGIQTTVDFNSTNNVIVGEGNGYIDDQDMKRINRQYHDQPETHIYFLIARTVNGKAGGARPLWGAALGLEMADRYDIRFLIMHEFGHCIGIGLHDDTDREVYSSSGFMGYYSPNITEYCDDDWESAFAPDGLYGNQTWKTARIWNRYSVYGELYDDTADVTGRANGEIRSQVHMYLKEIDGTNEYSALVGHYDEAFFFQPKPGNYTLEVSDGYRLVEPVFVNVTEREVIHLGNVAIERVEVEVEVPPPVESPPDHRMMRVLAAAILAAVLFLAFALWIRKRDADRPRGSRKIMAAALITALLLLVPSYLYLGPNDIYDAVTVNEFFDDRIDRNDDGVIDQEDYPLGWHSYSPGDRVVVRDRIETIWFQPDENRTYIDLSEYSGKYSGLSWGITSICFTVPGNVTAVHSIGEIITVENKMVDMESYGYDVKMGGWTIVK